MRLFFAHLPPEEVRHAVRRGADAALADVPNGLLRRVPVRNLHLTLRFLGPTDVSRVAPLVEEVRRGLAGVSPFELSVGGLGAFPSWRRPSVLWAGVESPGEELNDLAHRLERVCRVAGFSAERRPFRGHVTVARVRRAPDAVRSAVAPPVRRRTVVARWTVEHVGLFRSDHGSTDRTPGPARYLCVESFPLAGGRRSAG